jgi:tRNA threonylcarbamoyladenosine biosynthesis protein TsaB
VGPLLIIDTSLGACQAAVTDADGRLLHARCELMSRGHQERLGPMVRQAMSAAKLAFVDLDTITVTVGPGSFTGVRVGLAFAKGLSLALGRPCLGAPTLAALAASRQGGGRVAAVVDAGRSLCLQIFDGPIERTPGETLSLEAAAACLAEHAPVQILIGPNASGRVERLPAERAIDLAAPTPEAIAAVAVATGGPPRPIYLRAPDARLPA